MDVGSCCGGIGGDDVWDWCAVADYCVWCGTGSGVMMCGAECEAGKVECKLGGGY